MGILFNFRNKSRTFYFKLLQGSFFFFSTLCSYFHEVSGQEQLIFGVTWNISSKILPTCLMQIKHTSLIFFIYVRQVAIGRFDVV